MTPPQNRTMVLNNYGWETGLFAIIVAVIVTLALGTHLSGSVRPQITPQPTPPQPQSTSPGSLRQLALRLFQPWHGSARRRPPRPIRIYDKTTHQKQSDTLKAGWTILSPLMASDPQFGAQVAAQEKAASGGTPQKKPTVIGIL